MDIAGENGHWVILQNVHLVQKWLPTLERMMEIVTETAHNNFKLFISAEASSNPRLCVIPQVITHFLFPKVKFILLSYLYCFFLIGNS